MLSSESKLGSGKAKLLFKYDNFYSPSNEDFYRYNIYKDLVRSKENPQFRLLKIKPFAAAKQDISCELIDGLLLNEFRNKYVTISYFAGDPKQTRSILVNGKKFNVFATLFDSIQEACTFMRKRKSWYATAEFLLWADQICIDQSNPLERSHQVGIMRSIYEKADICIISLPGLSKVLDHDHGFTEPKPSKELYPDSQSAIFEILDRSLDIFERRDRDPGTFKIRDLIPGIFKSRNHVPDFAKQAEDKPVSIFASHPWWRRAWVQQEFLLSPEVYFVDHASEMQWKQLLRQLEQILNEIEAPLATTSDELRMRHKSSLAGNTEEIHYCCGMLSRKENENTVRNLRLEEVLSLVPKYEASDPRDKIYALLGLVAADYSIEPDYSPSYTVEDVLILAARRIIEFNHNLDILYNVWTEFRDLPSWVPDWRYEPPNFVRNPFVPSDTWEWSEKNVEFVKAQGEKASLHLVVHGICALVAHGMDPKTLQDQWSLWRSPSLVKKMDVRSPDSNPPRRNEPQIWWLFGCRSPVALESFGDKFKFRGIIDHTVLRAHRAAYVMVMALAPGRKVSGIKEKWVKLHIV